MLTVEDVFLLLLPVKSIVIRVINELVSCIGGALLKKVYHILPTKTYFSAKSAFTFLIHKNIQNDLFKKINTSHWYKFNLDFIKVTYSTIHTSVHVHKSHNLKTG